MVKRSEQTSQGVRVKSGKARPPFTPEETQKFTSYLAEIFSRLGLAASAGTQRTPARWLHAMVEMTQGYEGDPKIKTVFPGECPLCQKEELEQIVEGPIDFYALCEHHALPIRGQAWVGYLANEEILGISKLTRIVRVYASRFTTQERLTHLVADHLMSIVKPQGVAVYIEADHTCTQARGVRESQAKTRTFAVRGAYTHHSHLREEFMVLARLKEPAKAL